MESSRTTQYGKAPHGKLLIIQAAALGWEFVERHATAASNARWAWKPLETIFPAVTCPVQAAFRTARPPEQNGLWGNGFLDRRLRNVRFWEQSAALVDGPRLWETARAHGRTAGMMFWQQSMGESVDRLLSPRPIHKHHGGMIQDCYSRPSPWYEELSRAVGRPFNLMHYWGPLASRRSTDWIVDAIARTLQDGSAPDVLLTYLPHLDYDLQRHGPDSRAAEKAWQVFSGQLDRLREAADRAGYGLLVYGDYAMAPVRAAPVYLNRQLRQNGLLAVRSVRGRAYPDLFSSAAFAVVDHEVAFLYVLDPARRGDVETWLKKAEGLGALQMIPSGPAGMESLRPDWVLTAPEGSWYAYPWWEHPREAPDYATHVDIHNKPGYDPAELFWGFPPPRISLRAERVRGTHGRAGPGRRVAWATSCGEAFGTPETLLDLARATQRHLEEISP